MINNVNFQKVLCVVNPLAIVKFLRTDFFFFKKIKFQTLISADLNLDLYLQTCKPSLDLGFDLIAKRNLSLNS